MIKNAKVKKTEFKTEFTTDCTAFGYVGIILFTYRIFTSFLRNFAENSGSGAVMNSLLTSILMFAIIKLAMSLCRYTGSINLLDMCGRYLGSFTKYLIGIIVLLFALISVVNAIIEFSELAKITAFKTAPLWFVIIFFCGVVFLAQNAKMYSVFGVFSIISPIILILLILFFITSIRYGKPNNLFPIFGIDITQTFIKGLKSVSAYSDFVLLLFSGMCFERQNIKKVTKTIEIATIIGVFVNIFAVLIFTLCVAYPFSKNIANPLYNVTEIVYYGKFFQRADGFFMLVSLSAGLLYIAYASNIIIGLTKELFNIKSTCVSLFYTVLLGISSCFFSEKRLNKILNILMSDFSFIIGILLPLLLMLIIAVIYKSKNKNQKKINAERL